LRFTDSSVPVRWGSVSYIEGETRRWEGKITEKEKQQLARHCSRGIESRVISMGMSGRCRALVTHTSEELAAGDRAVKEPLPAGYAEAFVAVQEKWKHSLNCWSAFRRWNCGAGAFKLGIRLRRGYRSTGAVYDSTEHFWQAVKYHPDTTVA